jgi:hypothetical protein
VRGMRDVRTPVEGSVKRTALARVTPLKARKGLSRKTPLRAAGGLGRASQNRAAREPGTTNRKRPRRQTGPSQRTRNLVLARDNWQCAGCGKPAGGGYTWWSIQHRVARGVGGGNGPQALVLLCGSATSAGCHRACEDRDAVMHERGLWLRSTEDPALVPVTYWDGRVAFLTAAGGLIYEAGAA